MTIDDSRKWLEDIARDRKAIPARTLDAIEAARSQGLTWREIASRLEMTEEGVRKAVLRGRADA